jgi:hypothetical protein
MSPQKPIIGMIDLRELFENNYSQQIRLIEFFFIFVLDYKKVFKACKTDIIKTSSITLVKDVVRNFVKMDDISKTICLNETWSQRLIKICFCRPFKAPLT